MTEHLSLLNFRDLGGLATDDGHLIRLGILYRSEGPASFLEEHRRELTTVGFKLVCDLRADAERAVAPNDWAQGARVMHFDITNDLRTETNEGWSALRNDPTAAGAKRAMVLNYAAMPVAILPRLKALVDAIIAGELPVLLHCTAGKDRTGVLVALLLRALGVPHDAIVRDYARSDVFANNMKLAGGMMDIFEKSFGFRPSQETIDGMVGVDPAFLDAAFDAVDTGWGSIDSYFAAAGLNAHALARFRDTVLTQEMTREDA